MKKLIFLFGIILVSGVVLGQTVASWDSIRVPNGTDTTVYIRTSEQNWSASFDYKDFDDVDAILDLGESPPLRGFANRNTVNTAIFNRFDDVRLPLTLADSTVWFEKSQSNAKFLSIKLTKGSVTAGIYLRYYLTIW